VDQLGYALSTGPSGTRMEFRPPGQSRGEVSSKPEPKGLTLGLSVELDPAFRPTLLKPSGIRSSLERLGLTMEERKVRIELIIIDHLEKYPTDN